MTPEHFIRSFKRAYGRTPQNYRIHYLILQAKSLLSDTRLSVSGIANICGYSDQYYFSRLFKKHTGVTPSEYRRRHSV
jgi:AraC-like DNA-binding protein